MQNLQRNSRNLPTIIVDRLSFLARKFFRLNQLKGNNNEKNPKSFISRRRVGYPQCL
ncbi:hypothetical protein RLON56S_00925 [Alishewanella longhuensis]